MPSPCWDEDSVAWVNDLGDAVDLHFGIAFEDEVKFLADSMVMTLGSTTRWHTGLGKRLVFDGGVGKIQEAADGGTIFRGEGGLGGKGAQDHEGGWFEIKAERDE